MPLRAYLANNKNEDMWFDAILGSIELETPQQKHRRSMPRCRPNIKREGSKSLTN
jgi:hypothetical protein